MVVIMKSLHIEDVKYVDTYLSKVQFLCGIFYFDAINIFKILGL